jgi:sugar lactone lactonase YvrE
MKFGALQLASLMIFSIVGCGGGGGGNATGSSTPTLYSVNVTVNNLTASGLVLLNGADKLAVSPNSTSVTFPTLVQKGSTYQVQIGAQPQGYTQQCAVSNGAGVVGSANVVDIVVNCRATEAAVTTVAGSGSPGGMDGSSAQASFYFPQGVAVDSNGNLFVADASNNRIRKISAAGLVTTFAGNGNAGFSDGAASTASFRDPRGIAIDPAGNLYVADEGNSAIRKISPSGMVTTIAGSGAKGNADGIGPTASFLGPQGVALDSAGNVYVADTGNSLIRKITPSGTVSTIAGDGRQMIVDGVGRSASIGYPYNIAVDTSGNLFVTEPDAIRKILPDGTVTTFAGSAGRQGRADGTGAAALFYTPVGITVDHNGMLYVADFNNSLIRMIDQTGRVTTLAGGAYGNSIDGIGSASSFNHPSGIAVDSAGALYISDSFSNVIRKITPH